MGGRQELVSGGGALRRAKDKVRSWREEVYEQALCWDVVQEQRGWRQRRCHPTSTWSKTRDPQQVPTTPISAPLICVAHSCLLRAQLVLAPVAQQGRQHPHGVLGEVPPSHSRLLSVCVSSAAHNLPCHYIIMLSIH